MGDQDIIFVTGGCGFIGSNFIIERLKHPCQKIINLDLLTYASSSDNLHEIQHDKRYHFIKGDVNDTAMLGEIYTNFRPNIIIHFAAESHVDRSISDSSPFIRTNINGTHNLLEQTYKYYTSLTQKEQTQLRFIHISTDEVYGSLKYSDETFTEQSPYLPNSPYAASKAASNHLARAWYQTYNLPVIITCCSNNYGPRQHKEKLIPLVINNAIKGQSIPIYGTGENIRDWLHVTDHCLALLKVIEKGKIGELYNIGGGNEISNIKLTHLICELLNEIQGHNTPYKNLVKFTTDRKGHDVRYGINSGKVTQELGWKPSVDFMSGLKSTIEWYLS